MLPIPESQDDALFLRCGIGGDKRPHRCLLVHLSTSCDLLQTPRHGASSPSYMPTA
jgi:hypothetical protein